MAKTKHFGQHLAKAFTQHPRNNNDDEIEAYLDTPCQLSPALKTFFTHTGTPSYKATSASQRARI